MRLSSFQFLLLLVPAALASQNKRQATTTTSALNLQAEAASLVSIYVPPTAYAQLTASVASAASAASVTGDPASLFLSAILATNPPAWLNSAVPPYYSSNIAALESAVATLRSEAGTNTLVSTSTSETLVVTQTTNSLGSTVTTSFTSTFPVTSTHTTSSSGNAAAPTAGPQQQAGLGIAALALGLAAIF
ncbi:hypothetical protein Sste5346_004278 [Sporothrix stenoceras]|uniref:Uncharacterized protein n=1 Tax=Sporothrix stenoceras TaxID=5173 RepID=A0ABR3ZB60_9PEZI